MVPSFRDLEGEIGRFISVPVRDGQHHLEQGVLQPGGQARDHAEIEQEPRQEGRRMVALLSPKASK
jgi:hypothetical protein